MGLFGFRDMRGKFGWLAVMLMLVSGTAAAQPIVSQPSMRPGDLKVDFRAPGGAIVRYRIEMTQSRQKDGAAPVVTATQNSEVTFRVLSTRSDGYRMSLSYDRVESRSPQMKALGIGDDIADKIGKRFERTTLVYLADMEGIPTQIENLADIKEIMTRNIGTMRYAFKDAAMPPEAAQATEKMIASMEQLYAGMTPEQANHILLEDVRPLFGLTGISLPPDAEIQFTQKLPWALTGTMLDKTGKLWLSRQDGTQAVVEIRTGFDRDSVKQGLAVATRQLEARNNGTLPEQLARTLRSMENYDVIETQTTALRLADGWPDQVTLDQQTVTGPERRIKRIAVTRLP